MTLQGGARERCASRKRFLRNSFAGAPLVHTHKSDTRAQVTGLPQRIGDTLSPPHAKVAARAVDPQRGEPLSVMAGEALDNSEVGMPPVEPSDSI
jgi:hypothetical protein